MNNLTPRQAAEKALMEAVAHDHFFDMNDGERIMWMLERAFEFGRDQTLGPQSPPLHPYRRRVRRATGTSRLRRKPEDPTSRRSS